MDPVLVNQLKEALASVHVAHISHEERRNIQQFLDSFKENPTQCLTYSLQLCVFDKQNAEEFSERHFFLGCIKSVIQTHWNELTVQQKDETKQTILSILSRVCLSCTWRRI